jgi:cytochrome c556
MSKSTIVAGLLVLALAAAAAAAPQGSEAIAARQKILKSMGDATKPVGAMLKGEAPFDLAVVQTALKTYVDGTKQLPDLFPDDSKTGAKTEALPRIWEEKTRFSSIYAKLGDDAAAALTAINDEASFKANMGKVLGNCKACHDDFRQKK